MNIFSMSEAGGGARIPARDEIATADTWNLAALYPRDEAWQADFADLQGNLDGRNHPRICLFGNTERKSFFHSWRDHNTTFLSA